MGSDTCRWPTKQTKPSWWTIGWRLLNCTKSSQSKMKWWNQTLYANQCVKVGRNESVFPQKAPIATESTHQKNINPNHLGLYCKCLSYPESSPFSSRFASGGADKQVIIWTHKVAFAFVRRTGDEFLGVCDIGVCWNNLRFMGFWDNILSWVSFQNKWMARRIDFRDGWEAQPLLVVDRILFFQNRGLWACEKHTEIQNKAIGSTHFSFFTKTKKNKQ